MSARITRAARSAGWNVHFIDSTGEYFAGIYQYQPYSCAEIWKELRLCFKFDEEAEFAFCPQMPATSAIVLLSHDLDTDQKMPHPAAGSVLSIDVASHYASRCNGTHSRDTCLQIIDTPEPRIYPRYLAADDPTPEDPLVNALPTRRKPNSTSRKRSMSGSPVKSGSGSPSKEGADDVPTDIAPPTIADSVARKTRDTFRANCTTYNQVCAVTGMGQPWVPTTVGLGLEACHIVPQKHYHLYPLGIGGIGGSGLSEAWSSDKQSLAKAWFATWSAKNSLLLFSHIHTMFDARLLSIDPRTHLIRVFMPYGVLLPYHGTKATFNETKPPNKHALAFHWDCCVYENMTAEAQLMPVTRPLSPLLTRPDLFPPEVQDGRSSSPGDPSKRTRTTAAGPSLYTVTTRGGTGGAELGDSVGAGVSGAALTPDSMGSFIKEEQSDPPLNKGEMWNQCSVKVETDGSTNKRGWREDEEESMMGRGRTKKQKVVTAALDTVLDSVEIVDL